MVVRFVYFCLILYVMYSYCYVYVFILLRSSVLYILFSCVNWHSPTTLLKVLPFFSLSCKANARVYLAKTGHGPHSSQLVKCVVLSIAFVVSVLLRSICL